MASDLCLWANKGTGMRTGFGTHETYSRHGRTPPLEEQKDVQLLVTAAALIRSGLAIKLVLSGPTMERVGRCLTLPC